MDFQRKLSDDFVMLLKLCRKPAAVFDPESRDYDHAVAWLDKLSRYQCDNLDQRRLRNIYMSHFVVCLNEGKLVGPFLEEPAEGRLEDVDFIGLCCLGSESHRQYIPDVTDKCLSKCKAKKGSHCLAAQPSSYGPVRDSCDSSCTRQQACKTKPICKPPKQTKFKNNTTMAALVSQPENIDFMRDYETNLTSPAKNMGGYDSPLNATITGCCTELCQTPSADQLLESPQFRSSIAGLLGTIEAELRGELKPGVNEYLESELVRYSSFIMSHSELAFVLCKMQLKENRRSFLLIHLQKELSELLLKNIPKI